jgi:lipoprotein-releasing system permease protein
MIGARYIRAKQRNSFISFISLVSVLGLILGVAVLVIVVSVMNGFDRELRHRILGVVPHGVVLALDESGLENWQQLAEQLEGHPQIMGVAPFARTRGMLTSGGAVNVIELYGVSPEHESNVSIIPEYMTAGTITDLVPGSNGIVLGRALANALGVMAGQQLTLVIPEATAKGMNVKPRIIQVRLVDTFEVGVELDYKLALMHVDDLSGHLSLKHPVQGVRVRFADLLNAPEMLPQITLGLTDGAYKSETWADQYGDLFKTVEMEKAMMFLLLLLIVAIAAFNIISGLVMLVDEKRSDIAILRTLGISPGSVMAIFVVQGSIIGIAGTLLGLVLGSVLAFNISDIVGFFEELANEQVLAGTYFDSVPSDFRLPDVLVIGLVSLGISVVATIYPAWRASRLDPSDVLRYE